MTTVRPCTPEDLPVLRALSCSTFRETFAGSNAPSDLQAHLERAYAAEKLRGELTNPASAFYFAELDGAPVGYLKLNEAPAQTELHDAHALEIERIYVSQSAQGRGLGGLLMDRAVTAARALGKQFVWLGVWEHNPRALAFYQKHGFYRIGAHSFFVGEDEQTDILLRKDL